MKALNPGWFVALALVLAFPASADDRIYRSVDEAGRVTYSSLPPVDAVEVDGVEVAPGPSEHAREDARARVEAIEARTDARLKAMMERRRLELQARSEAREEAERRRLVREAEDRQRRMEESLDRLSSERPYYPIFSYEGRWPYPPHGPIGPIHPPRPPHRIISPNRPYDSHINSPARR